jgi:hypothetical protein
MRCFSGDIPVMRDESGGQHPPLHDGVWRMQTCALKTIGGAWPFAEKNSKAIDANWIEAAKRNSGYFNGTVYLARYVRFGDGRLEASFIKTEFKSYLYWRMQGFPEAGVLDGFGSALIRTSDGCIVLGRQKAGNVNGGLAYPPSGFIDGQDIQPDGSIDIAGSATREVLEETGIEGVTLARSTGFYLTRSGAQLSIAVPFSVAMTAKEFVRTANQHIADTPDPELDEVIAVASLGDIAHLAMPAYARLLLQSLLQGT